MTKAQVIGQPLTVGGNTAQLTSNGKVRITNAEGKTKDISAKSFQKQLIQNADKINKGDSFEFKSNDTAKKVAAGIGIAGAVTGLAAAVIYRKNITKFFKDTDFKKLGADLMEKGKKQFDEGIDGIKKLYNNGMEKVKKFGSDALKYIKEIPEKFPKFKKAAAEAAETAAEETAK